MTSHLRAAVWLDHHEARIFHVDRGSFDEQAIRSPHRHVHRHPKGSTEPHEYPDDVQRFFGDIARSLADANEILIVGPSTAKLQFHRYLQTRDPALEQKIVGLETVDHPTDAQLVAYAKKYFRVPDPRVR